MPVVKGKYRAPTSPKQDELRRMCKKKKFMLAQGPRRSTKTMGCIQCVCDHAWNVKNANIAIITVTQSVGVNSGVWDDLVLRAIPERIKGAFGFAWVSEPHNETSSKIPTCSIQNKWGQEVKIQLFSLKDEGEVERRFKGPRFSMIYVPELSEFRFEKTFVTWTECLRMPGELGVTREEKADIPDNHLFLGDTNPAPEGEDSWIYKLWFDLLETAEEAVPPEKIAWKRGLGRVDFVIDDNIFDTKEQLDELKGKYLSDKDLWDRYIEGKWIKASTDAIFYGVWSDQLHTAGHPVRKDDPDAEILMPDTGCYELMTGWDLGDRNCAFVIEEKVIIDVERPPLKLGEAPRIVSAPAFKVLDEHIVIAQDFILEEFVEVVLEKMDTWEKRMERVGKVIWKHWSDRNVFHVRDLSGRVYLNHAVHIASDRRINLVGAYDAQAGSGSVDARLSFTRTLLFENRVMVSKRCPRVIEMFKSIRRKRDSATGIAKGSKFKHAFDAASYVWCSVCYEEMAKAVLNRVRKAGDTPGGLVQIPTIR